MSLDLGLILGLVGSGISVGLDQLPLDLKPSLRLFIQLNLEGLNLDFKRVQR